jgi:glycosyltransferase involved in cell wall biosynthesis
MARLIYPQDLPTYPSPKPQGTDSPFPVPPIDTPATTSDPIRVLLWSPAGSGDHYHGPGSFMYRLYSGAAPGRFDISLAHGLVGQKEYPLFRAQHRIAPLGGGGIASLRMWRFLWRARSWLRSHAREFDVFHGLTAFHVSLAPAIEAQRLGVPAAIFMAAHNKELTDKAGLKRLLGLPRRRRKMIREVAAVIAMTQLIHEELVAIGVPERRIARIPMGVDMQRFHPPVSMADRAAVRAELGWPERFTLAFVGGLTQNKRPHLLMEALALLRKQGVEAQVAFIGPDHNPEYVAGIKSRSRELGVADLLIWHGFTPDVSPLLRGCDCFALPSTSEGMPASMVEAMASGMPVIATPISGAVDLVQEDRTGLFVQPDPQDIARTWRVYVDQPERAWREGQAARMHVQNTHSREAVLDAHERMFRRIMTGGDAAE